MTKFFVIMFLVGVLGVELTLAGAMINYNVTGGVTLAFLFVALDGWFGALAAGDLEEVWK
jgi:hypothetical protein